MATSLTGADVFWGGGGGGGGPPPHPPPPYPPFGGDVIVVQEDDSPDMMLPTGNQNNWNVAHRTNRQHQTGVAVLAYTNEMSPMIIAHERRMLDASYFIDNVSEETMNNMCPYLVFFAPMEALQRIVGNFPSIRDGYLGAIQQEFVHLELILGNPPVEGPHCTTRIRLTDGDGHRQQFSRATDYVRMHFEDAIKLLYRTTSVFEEQTTTEFDEALRLVKKSMERMSAAFKSAFKLVPVSNLSLDDDEEMVVEGQRMPVRLFRGMKNVPWSSSPLDVLCTLKNSYSSWTTSMAVAKRFAYQSADPDNDQGPANENGANCWLELSKTRHASISTRDGSSRVLARFDSNCLLC